MTFAIYSALRTEYVRNATRIPTPLPFSDPYQSSPAFVVIWSHPYATCKGEFVMVLDNEAIIALGFLVSILVVTGGLLYFVLTRMKR